MLINKCKISGYRGQFLHKVCCLPIKPKASKDGKLSVYPMYQEKIKT